MEPPEELSQHEPGDTSPCINRCKDKQGLEHYGEVIPVLHQAAHPWQTGEYLRDADCQRDCATGSPSQVLFACLLSQLFKLLFVKIEGFGAVGLDELNVVGSRPIDIDG